MDMKGMDSLSVLQIFSKAFITLIGFVIFQSMLMNYQTFGRHDGFKMQLLRGQIGVATEWETTQMLSWS